MRFVFRAVVVLIVASGFAPVGRADTAERSLSRNRGATGASQVTAPGNTASSAKANSAAASSAQRTFGASPRVSEESVSQPAAGVVAGVSNDDCANAEGLASLGTFAFNNLSATTDGPDHAECDFSGESGIASDLWYFFVAPLDCTIQIDTCDQTSVNTKIAVYGAGACPTAADAPIVCNDDACGLQSSVTFEATTFQGFFIRIGSRPGTLGGGGSFTISCVLCDEDANGCQGRAGNDADNSNREDFVAVDGFSPAQDGSVSEICWWGAYDNGVSDCQATSADRFEITYYADLDGFPDTNNILGFFSQVGGTLNVQGPIVTGDFIQIVLDPGLPPLNITEYALSATHDPVPVLAGQCYWVQITNSLISAGCNWFWEYGVDGDGRVIQDGFPLDGFGVEDVFAHDLAFCVDISTGPPGVCLPPPPLNDDCLSPTQVFEGETLFETYGATTDGAAEPTCEFVLGDDQINKDIWFVHQSTCNETLQFSLCGSAYDTKIAVYDGNACPATALEVCNDDFCLLQSQVLVPSQVGDVYKIRVGGFLDFNTGIADSGPGRLIITCAPVPPNDTCQGTQIANLDVNTSITYTGSNLNASADCNLLDSAQVWLAFDLLSEASVTIDYAGTDPVFADAWLNLIQGCPCAAVTQVFPFDTKDTSDGNFVLASGCLQPGVYYYPVLSESGSLGDYEITISGVPCDRCEGATGDCFSSHLGIGCDDADCCANVCNLDLFCCVVEWDVLCASGADQVCGGFNDFCAQATGDCCSGQPSGVGGCGNAACCISVCECDLFCCDVNWDEFCATLGFNEGGCGAGVLCGQLCSGCPDAPIGYVDPPVDWQDARQPHELTDAAIQQGVDTLIVSGPDGAESLDCWSLCETTQNVSRHPGVVANTITDVFVSGPGEYTILLAHPLTPGEITRLTLGESGANTLEYRVLPGDVNADGSTTPADILAEIDCLNDVAGIDCGLTRTDADRSDETGASDILRIIDMLHGASEFESWLDASLVDEPCP